MREIEQMARGGKMLKVETSKEVQQVLTLIDTLIGGKRFGEMDTAKQMYFLNCQARINTIQSGECNEEDITFLLQAIDSLMCTLTIAKDELEKILK